jgi:hypothetical protein
MRFTQNLERVLEKYGEEIAMIHPISVKPWLYATHVQIP